MSQERLIKLASTESSHVIWTSKKKGKSRKGVERKLELAKYDPILRKRVLFKESRK